MVGNGLKKPDGTLTENDLEKAEVLKSFFHSVFTDDKDDKFTSF